MIGRSAWTLLRSRPRTCALLVFILLACVHTWPLIRNPAHLSRIDNGDALLNIWAIGWVAHQLPRDPLHLFDANIFYPERYTLAYSEAMIVQGVLALPVIKLGGSALLAYNIVLLEGFALTGWAFCLLIERWTGSWAAGYTGGLLAAFNSHVLVRLVHLQVQHVEFIALMLFALDRLVASQRTRDAALLGFAFALEGLTSVYLLVFSTWMLIFSVAARAPEWIRRGALTMLAKLALAGAIAVGLLAPYLLGYFALHQSAGFERSLDDAVGFAGTWRDFLSTGSRIHFDLWASRFFEGSMSASFPGIVCLLLVVLALTWSDTRADRRVWMCLVTAAGCLAVAMLPKTPWFPVLYDWIPLFHVVRVEAHLELIVLLMLAIVAGYGVAGLGRRWPNPRTWPAVALALCALVNLEALRAPLEFRDWDGIPAVYDVLKEEPRAVIVELPFYVPHAFFGNAKYMLNSTEHWRPMLNGYSGFRPGSYDETFHAIERFPDMGAMAALHERGVTHVVVHKQELGPDAGPLGEAIAASPAMTLVAGSPDVDIYRLR